MTGHPTLRLHLTDDNGNEIALLELDTPATLTTDPGRLESTLKAALGAFARTWDEEASR